jgi:hypothetical protein
MDGRSQRLAGPLTRRQKRLMALAGALVVVVLGGVSAWAVINPDAYSGSRNGCVTVSVPSSTGGAIVHDCGAGARAMCLTAFAHRDEVSLLTQTQCRLAGLRPSAAPPSPSAPAAVGGN